MYYIQNRVANTWANLAKPGIAFKRNYRHENPGKLIKNDQNLEKKLYISIETWTSRMKRLLLLKSNIN